MFCHIVRYFCVNFFDCFELPLLLNVLKFQLSFNFFLCVFPKVREIYRNLQTSKTLGKIFAKHKLIDCKRQPSNLKRLLCSSNFSTNKPTFKTTKCGKSCFCCDYITEAELFKFKNWRQSFVLKSNFNCGTPNLIYVIICGGCNKEYIGQTGWIPMNISQHPINQSHPTYHPDNSSLRPTQPRLIRNSKFPRFTTAQ